VILGEQTIERASSTQTWSKEDRHMPLINPELRSRVSPVGALILYPSADEVITLNSSGGYIWARLQEGKTVEEIVAALAKETGQDPSVVGNDVHEFLRQLTAKLLVTL
jgi:hypothetical protein